MTMTKQELNSKSIDILKAYDIPERFSEYAEAIQSAIAGEYAPLKKAYSSVLFISNTDGSDLTDDLFLLVTDLFLGSHTESAIEEDGMNYSWSCFKSNYSHMRKVGMGNPRMDSLVLVPA